MSTGEETGGWARAHKKLMATVAAATAIIGLASAALALRDQLSPAEDGPSRAASPAAPAATAAQAGVTPASAAKLSDDVQIGRFEELLGPPVDRKRLQNDEWLVSTWESPDIAVKAFSNRDEQVVAYTLTSLTPDYTPLVEHVRGGVRLRESVFAEVPDRPAGMAGVFPPNGRWSYQELHLGGGATAGRSVVLSAAYAANADEQAATELAQLGDCLALSVFELATACAPERIEPVREQLSVTSMTVGTAAALEALAADGAVFHAEADGGA